MRKLALILVLSISGFSVSAADRCLTLMNIVYGQVSAKDRVLAEAKRDSVAEPWGLLVRVYEKELNKLSVPAEEQIEISKSILTLNYSNDSSLEADVFAEYYYINCKLRNKIQDRIPLADIPAKSIMACLNSGLSSKKMQKCYSRLFIRKR